MPEVKKVWGIPSDQVKVLHKQIASGELASEKYQKHNVFSNLPEVKQVSFKKGRGNGFFFNHSDGRKEKISVHQLDAYHIFYILCI